MAENIFAEETEEKFSERFSEMIFSSITCLAVAMGEETGLFQVMTATDTPRTSQEIADAGNFKERYVREWLSTMVTSHIVNYDPVKETYWLPAHRRCVTNSLASWSLLPPVLSTAFFPLAQCFKKDGPAGVSYEVYPKFDHTLNKIHGPLFENTLLNDVLPTMPELLEKLESGIKVIDVGCGPGSSTLVLAKRFPKSQIYGLDQAEKPLIKAREEAKSIGLTNAIFVCTDVATLPADWTGQYGYAFAHMIIHDLAVPPKVLKEILRVLTPGGVLSVFDPKLESDLQDNISHTSRSLAYATSTFYAVSMMNCVPTSLFTEGGAGLGVGFGRRKMTELLKEIGFAVTAVGDGMEGSWHFLCNKKLAP